MDDKKYEKVISRLNVGSVNLDFIGPGSNKGLNNTEIAGVLAGLDDKRFQMGWMFLTQDYSKFSLVSLYTLNQLVKIAIQESWKIPKRKPILRTMSELAVIESLAPKLCKTCRGHGQSFDLKKNLVVECSKCKGTGGGSAFTKTRRAKILSFDKDNFNKKWSARYDKAFMIPYGWLMDVFEHINKNS